MKFIEAYDHIDMVDESIKSISTRAGFSAYPVCMDVSGDSTAVRNLYNALKLGHAINASFTELQRLMAYMVSRLSRTDTCLVFDFTAHPGSGQVNLQLQMRASRYMPLSFAAISADKLTSVLKHYVNKGEHRLVFSAYGLFWIQQKLH